MDIRTIARRRADRQMSLHARAINDQATEHFDLARTKDTHVATRYARLEERASHEMAKADRRD